MKIKSMHLIKNQDITEDIQAPFAEVKEGAIDPDNRTIRGVCVFGTRESANNRIYQNKAIESLAKHTSGAKMFLNHPTNAEMKDSGGVRRIQDWAGVFSNARRDGDKVFADLRVREAYWDLVEDIAHMAPKNVGHSINARVKLFTDEKGMESVVDLDSLKSVDLVSSAATTSSLFEAAQEKAAEHGELEIFLPLVESHIEAKFRERLAKEGVLTDQIAADKIRREINDLNWSAVSLIEDCLWLRGKYKDKDLKMDDKKKEITSILDDLDKEIAKRVTKIKDEEGKESMEITLEMLKKDYPQIVESILAETKTAGEMDRVKKELATVTEAKAALEKQAGEKDKVIKEQTDKIVGLEKTVKEQAIALDKYAVTEKLAAKKVMVEKILSESKMPKEAQTEVFMGQLMAVEERKDGEKVVTVEEQVKILVADRLAFVNASKGKVTNLGEDFNPASVWDKKSTKTVEEAAKDFENKIK